MERRLALVSTALSHAPVSASLQCSSTTLILAGWLRAALDANGRPVKNVEAVLRALSITRLPRELRMFWMSEHTCGA